MASGNKYNLILASKSPRRKELLSWLDIPFEIKSQDIPEESNFINPFEVAEDIASQKGMAVYEVLEKQKGFGETYFPLLVASDTIVCLDGKIFGKPSSVEDARKMLLELSERTHEVITSVYIGACDLVEKKYREKVFSCKTKVEFSSINEDLLENYLASRESMDKAGAYGIQGKGLTFISRVEGSYSNVVGFPLHEFITELKTFLGYAEDTKGEWRKLFHV